MRTLFGFEAPGKLLEWILYSAFPTFVRGAVAGLVALAVTHYAYKGTRQDLAIFVTGGLYTGVMVVSELLSYAMHGPSPAMINMVVEVIGLWVGLISAAEAYAKSSYALD
jgi:hypothetical protein